MLICLRRNYLATVPEAYWIVSPSSLMAMSRTLFRRKMVFTDAGHSSLCHWGPDRLRHAPWSQFGYRKLMYINFRYPNCPLWQQSGGTVYSLVERRGYWRAVVAIAAKNARLCWASLHCGDDLQVVISQLKHEAETFYSGSKPFFKSNRYLHYLT